jgi:hypothetical protein
MAKTRFHAATLLLGLCCFPLSDCGPPGGRARGNAPGPHPSEVGLVERNCLRRLRTEEEFRAVLRADRVALFFLGKWSTDSVLAKALVENWVRERQPPFGVFLVDPDEQPYVRAWLAGQERDDAFQTYQRKGAVLWLRRGEIAAETLTPRLGGQRELGLLTLQAFGRRP